MSKTNIIAKNIPIGIRPYVKMKRGVINNSVRKYLRECTFVSEENIDMKIIKENVPAKTPKRLIQFVR